jgi:tetratricopeptide (TPR) repeat protein
VKPAVLLPAVLLLFCASLYAQAPSAWGSTLVVIPFENASPTPGLEWLGEGFSESLRWRLDSPVLYVASREERLRGYDRLGIPAGLHPSRATLFRLAEQMDVDYALLGSYRYDGQSLTATGQLLDMRGQKLLPPQTESAPLSDLGNLQSALAWDLLRQIRPNFEIPKDKYIASVPPLRLDAMENYIRGILASSAEEKVEDYREAVRVNPAFSEAWLDLGKSYFTQRSYEPATIAFEKIPLTSPVAREANFYLGLSSCAQGNFEKAETAFAFVAARLPLAEVYNNLGVVAGLRGEKKAAEDFAQAIHNDPSDPDFHFNLGVALSQSGDKTRAIHELRVALQQRSNDGEAKMLLDSLAPPAGSIINSAATVKLPAERLKRTYEENAFRQMTTQMQAWAEQQFARSDVHAHARYHIELGRELLAHGFTSEAESEFRHAARIDPASTAPLTALADLYESRGDAGKARAEAEAALRTRESVDAYLILTRLDLRENRVDAATENINRVLQLEPGNPAAQELKRTLAARVAEKTP